MNTDLTKKSLENIKSVFKCFELVYSHKVSVCSGILEKISLKLRNTAYYSNNTIIVK